MELENGKSWAPKRLVAVLASLLIIFVALLVVEKIFEIRDSLRNKKTQNTLVVSAEGKVSSSPNLATVTIGVLSQGQTAVDVKNQNNEKMNKVIAYIKSSGVDSKDIATGEFSFYPQQSYEGGPGRIVGYQGNQTVTLKVHGVDKDKTVLEKILDGAVNNGANQIDGVSLSVENPDALLQEAQQKAIEAAKKKAQALAQSAGLRLGKVMTVSETSSPSTPFPVAYASGGSLMNARDEKSVSPDVQTGSQDFTETMTVTFEVQN